MKTLTSFLILLFITINIAACGNNSVDKNTTKNDNTLKTQKIEVYYFHNTRRCATCNAVEDVTKAALKEFYSEQTENDQIVFQSLDLGEGTSKSLIEKYEVSGPTLLFISGEKIVNLTNEGFMYARSKPEKFKKEIKKTVDQFLGQD